MTMKEDLAIVKTDTKWMKQGIQDLQTKVSDFLKVTDERIKLVEGATECNEKEIVAAKAWAKGFGTVTVLIAIVSFCIAVYSFTG